MREYGFSVTGILPYKNIHGIFADGGAYVPKKEKKKDLGPKEIRKY